MLSLQSYGNAALKLHENGYIPIPIIPATKGQALKIGQVSKMIMPKLRNYPRIPTCRCGYSTK